MARIGVRKPRVALYENDNGTVTYTGLALLAKAVEYSSSIKTGDSNNLYADDAIAESDKSFGSGDLSITTDDLLQAGSKLILGVQEHELTVGEETVTELIYDDDTQPPYLGFGIIIPGRRNGTDYYRAVVFTKIQFNIPDDAAKTRGENIEWQTPALTAAIYRDDSAKRRWKRESTFTDETAADAYIETVLDTGAVG
jgi:phi13 family phage major tail protein